MTHQKSFMQVLSEAFNARQGERGAHEACEKEALAKPVLHTGRIYSTGLNAAGVPCAAIQQDGKMVEIPYSELLVYPAEEHPLDKETAARHLSKMVGAEIDYIITSAEGATALTGSRLAAMARRRAEELPKIHTGDKVRARVVVVMKSAAILEAAGIETVVRKQEFSWEWLSGLYGVIQTGETVDAKVMVVSHEIGRLELSPRELEESPFSRYGWMYKEQMRCKGTVTGTLDVFYYVKLEGPGPLLCMCSMIKSVETPPIVGSKVALVITQVDNERQRLRGRIVSVTQV